MSSSARERALWAKIREAESRARTAEENARWWSDAARDAEVALEETQSMWEQERAARLEAEDRVDKLAEYVGAPVKARKKPHADKKPKQKRKKLVTSSMPSVIRGGVVYGRIVSGSGGWGSAGAMTATRITADTDLKNIAGIKHFGFDLAPKE